MIIGTDYTYSREYRRFYPLSEMACVRMTLLQCHCGRSEAISSSPRHVIASGAKQSPRNSRRDYPVADSPSSGRFSID